MLVQRVERSRNENRTISGENQKRFFHRMWHVFLGRCQKISSNAVGFATWVRVLLHCFTVIIAPSSSALWTGCVCLFWTMHVNDAIYISRDGKTLGRFRLEQIKALSAKGVLRGGDLVWEDSQAEWLPLSDFMEAASSIDAGRDHAKMHVRAGEDRQVAPETRSRYDVQSASPNSRSFVRVPTVDIKLDTPNPATPELFTTRWEGELASAVQISYIEERCGWAPSGVTKNEAARLIQRLKTEILQEPFTDEQLRQMCFFGIEFSRDTTCLQAEKLIAEYLDRSPDAEDLYLQWRQASRMAGVLVSHTAQGH